MIHYRVIVIGGGPAGAACAGRLIQKGIDCLILDKAVFPRTKVCAGWITPEVFNNLDISPSKYPLSLTTFPSLRINLGRVPLIRKGTQYAIRRFEFDDWLLKRSGSEVIRHEVKDIQKTKLGFQIDDQFTSEFIVGAGGTHCPLYHRFFKEEYPRLGSAIAAMEEEYKYEWKDPTCQLWFFWNGLPGYAWYVPKKDGYVNIGIGGNARKIKESGGAIHDYWDQFVSFLTIRGFIQEREFQPKGYLYYLRGHGSVSKYGNLYLVGDAAGLSTLDMGEGIGPAIQSGLLAARSIIQGTEYLLEDIPRYSLLPAGLRWLIKSNPDNRG